MEGETVEVDRMSIPIGRLDARPTRTRTFLLKILPTFSSISLSPSRQMSMGFAPGCTLAITAARETHTKSREGRSVSQSSNNHLCHFFALPPHPQVNPPFDPYSPSSAALAILAASWYLVVTSLLASEVSSSSPVCFTSSPDSEPDDDMAARCCWCAAGRRCASGAAPVGVMGVWSLEGGGVRHRAELRWMNGNGD